MRTLPVSIAMLGVIMFHLYTEERSTRIDYIAGWAILYVTVFMSSLEKSSKAGANFFLTNQNPSINILTKSSETARQSNVIPYC